MAGRIPQTFINDLLGRIDIVDVIGERLTLKKAGRNHLALCPFHQEKTPSFSVNAEKQYYYCFGCNATGTALTFLMQHDRLDFIAAVETLAARAGVEVPREQGAAAKTSNDKPLYDVLAWADRWFQQTLRTHPQSERVKTYLKGRGVTGVTARDFGIGFAPPGWDTLVNALESAQRDAAVTAGLLSRTDEGRVIDRFRDRVMFPIRDTRGRIVGFGGRVLDSGQPKYLNSPETPVFHKGRELYGLFDARRAVRNPERFVLVEGYMDVIALVQAGVPTAVASLGTASGTAHFEALFRHAAEVVCCFDGDTAGRNAAWKALDVALPLMKQGRQLKFMFLPDGEDPDTLVRKEGKGGFETRLAGAMTATDYLFQRLQQGLDLRDDEGKARFVALAQPHIDLVPDQVLKALMNRRLADLVQLPVVTVERVEAPRELPRRGRRRQATASISDRLLAVVLTHPDFFAGLDADRQAELLGLSDSIFVRVVRAIAERPTTDTGALMAYFAGDPEHDRLARLAGQVSVLDKAALRREFEDGVGQILEVEARENRRALVRDLQEDGSAEKLAHYWRVKQGTN